MYPFIHHEFIFGPLVESFSSVCVCVLIHSLLLICACMHLRCMRKLACMAGFTVQVSAHVSLKVGIFAEQLLGCGYVNSASNLLACLLLRWLFSTHCNLHDSSRLFEVVVNPVLLRPFVLPLHPSRQVPKVDSDCILVSSTLAGFFHFICSACFPRQLFLIWCCSLSRYTYVACVLHVS